MSLPSFEKSRTVAACRFAVRVASLLVPAGRRADWRAEWDGELHEQWRRTALASTVEFPGARLMAATLGAVPHAFAELAQEWSPSILGHELRNAARFLGRNRGFTLTAALLISLGVGANTTVFTLVNAVMLRAPRGITEPARMAQIGRGGTDARDFDSWSYPVYRELRERNKVFTDLAAYATLDVSFGRDDNVSRGVAQLVSANYFRVLGATVRYGRSFADDEEQGSAASVAVISDGLWRRQFAGSPETVGKSIDIRGRAFRVIGIAAPEFSGADVGSARPDVWLPLSAVTEVAPGGMERLDSRFISWLWIAGRLAPGVEAATAQTSMRVLFRQLQLDRDGQVRDELLVIPGLGLRPAERALASSISATLLAMVAAVLLVACANLAALLLARGAARQSELGVRLALGASRGRVIRQLLIETILISILGSALAFVFTRWTAHFVEWIMPYPISVSLQPDTRVLLFALAIGVGASVAFGLLPAARSARVDLLSLLRAGAPGMSARRGRARAALLIGQAALSFMLLAITGLLLHTVQRANNIDPGFRTDDVLVGDLDLRGGSGTDAARAERLAAVAASAAQIPGVAGVALASDVPATGTMSNRTLWRADDDFSKPAMPAVSMLIVDTGYFHVMGVPIVRGRQFEAAHETVGAPSAIVINETLARRLWPGQDAVGQQISLGSINGERHVPVIGIARDTRNRSLRSPPGPQAYLLLGQNPAGHALLHIRIAPEARASGAALGATLTSTLRPLLSGAPAPRFTTVRERLAAGLADIRLIGLLAALFGGLALALAAAGIYGVVSYETGRRQREYGIRLALGARPSQINGVVLWQTGRTVCYGILIGLAATAAVSPLLHRWLSGVPFWDPLSYAGATLVLAFAAFLAALGPSIRASLTDPISSLRAD